MVVMMPTKMSDFVLYTFFYFIYKIDVFRNDFFSDFMIMDTLYVNINKFLKMLETFYKLNSIHRYRR